MADMKAAAKRLRGGDWTTPSQDKADRFLAAQALEAWAWQQETGALVAPLGENEWVCRRYDDQRTRHTATADTPLGAALAAMEGERDGRD